MFCSLTQTLHSFEQGSFKRPSRRLRKSNSVELKLLLQRLLFVVVVLPTPLRAVYIRYKRLLWFKDRVWLGSAFQTVRTGLNSFFLSWYVICLRMYVLQLLAVLPAASKTLLPTCYHDLMTSDDSPIKKYYPVEFRKDLNGKRQDWEAVVLVPFIDEVSKNLFTFSVVGRGSSVQFARVFVILRITRMSFSVIL